MTDVVNAFTERLPHGPGAFEVAVKDTIWMNGLRATRGSRAFADFICPEDAVAVRRLRAAGAAIVGRTTNPELCFRGVTQSVLHGVTRNPFDLSRVSGGSSGGSGAAVASGAVPMALGTAAWFALVKLLPTQVAALSSIAIPIVAVISGVLLLHEPLSALQAVAIGSTVVSLWLALVPRRSVG